MTSRASTALRVVSTTILALLILAPLPAHADDDDYPASVVTRTEVRAKSPVKFGASSTAKVTVRSDAGGPTGSVAFSLDSKVFATERLDARSSAQVEVPAALLTPGTHEVRASYLPTAGSRWQPSSRTDEIVVRGSGNRVAAKQAAAPADPSDRDVATDRTQREAVAAAAVRAGDDGGDAGGFTELPDTGGVWLGLIVLGLVAVGLGAFVVRRSRRA